MTIIRPMLNIDQLVQEYFLFGVKNRNSHDERFGQYIYNKYFFEYGNSYNEEDKKKALNILMEAMGNYQL